MGIITMQLRGSLRSVYQLFSTLVIKLTIAMFLQDSCRDILYAMLSIDPAARPSAAEILSSAWVEGVDCCIPAAVSD
jgi:serine/threonine protein kinase